MDCRLVQGRRAVLAQQKTNTFHGKRRRRASQRLFACAPSSVLSSGGNGFDQRFIDGISRGCVPVLTQLNTSHPFEILLNYESFTIRAPGEMMRDLPEVLEDTVSSGKYAKMLLNLRVVREAIAWNVTSGREENGEYDTFTVNNGAYYHTLAAIALRTKKKLPESVAEKLCKLYFENEYHENAWKDVLNEEFRK